MMIGIAKASVPASRAAFRKVMGPPRDRHPTSNAARSLQRQPPAQIGGQRLSIWLISAKRHEIDLMPPTTPREVVTKFRKVFQVRLSKQRRVEHVLDPSALQALEL